MQGTDDSHDVILPIYIALNLRALHRFDYISEMLSLFRIEGVLSHQSTINIHLSFGYFHARF